jgi:hypothetical protein
MFIPKKGERPEDSTSPIFPSNQRQSKSLCLRTSIWPICQPATHGGNTMNTKAKIPDLGYFSGKNTSESHHNSITFQLDLGRRKTPQTLNGWAIRVHPFAGYTLQNSHHQYILGCFASAASAAKFADYLPAAADCDFGSVSFGGSL